MTASMSAFVLLSVILSKSPSARSTLSLTKGMLRFKRTGAPPPPMLHPFFSTSVSSPATSRPETAATSLGAKSSSQISFVLSLASAMTAAPSAAAGAFAAAGAWRVLATAGAWRVFAEAFSVPSSQPDMATGVSTAHRSTSLKLGVFMQRVFTPAPALDGNPGLEWDSVRTVSLGRLATPGSLRRMSPALSRLCVLALFTAPGCGDTSKPADKPSAATPKPGEKPGGKSGDAKVDPDAPPTTDGPKADDTVTPAALPPVPLRRADAAAPTTGKGANNLGFKLGAIEGWYALDGTAKTADFSASGSDAAAARDDNLDSGWT